ncbi:RHS repeat domain-containing protein [Pseudomonas sp. SMV71]|uniref:RHS repeat domain-containing protein n=1 Tax=Pseudomonas sp. SMV71 TaxID=3390195 RepID=UPI003F82A31B
MSVASSLHSNALNFMSSVKNGVDPRTGLYSIAINFPEVQTNDLRGPGFALALAYSSLNTEDSGYGFGWNLQLSQYTPANQVLALSTGETFKVTGSDTDSGQLVMKEKKLDSFHFYQEDDSHYRVVHKSGLVEILEVMGSSQNAVALPVEIRSPVGHKVTLGYAPFSGTYQILAWVKDDTEQTLLTVNRESTFIEVLLQPSAGPDSAPLGRFAMTLEGSDKYVSRISLPTENEASWRFGYNRIRDHLCITWVETPTGGREEIFYQDDGHQFPDNSGRTPLPRVTRHLTDPGFDQPQVDVRYTYKSEDPGESEKNFLGGGLRMSWEDNGLDNLYKYIGTYEYVCIETLWVQGDAEPEPRPVRKIERKFNQFHLLTRETTTQNNNVETVETTYYLTPNAEFDQQPKYCQLPKTVKTSWSLLNNPNRRRSETVSSTYDTFGNLRVKVRADGVIETNIWYSALGDDGCPADPEGFVRNLKEQTVTPAPSPNGQAPTLSTRYRYKELSQVGDSTSQDLPLKRWLTLESQMLVQLGTTETELEKTLFEHINDPTDAFLHGRVCHQTTTLNGYSTRVDYDYSKFDSPQFGVPVLQTTETLSTMFDDASKTIVRQNSRLTSQELSTHEDGVETHYYYDILNRVTREVVAPNTAFTAARDYEYILSSTHGQQAEHVSIDARRIKTRSVLDGLGRLIFQESDHLDSADSSRIRQTYAAIYNAWGELAEETEYDWLDGESRALKSTFYYDDWAQQSYVVGPGGVEVHQSLDPIGTPESQGPIQRNWIQSPGPSPMISGLSETWLNPFGKPTQVQTLDAAEEEMATETYLYDGLGRCTQHTDAAKYTTEFVYDAWSRLISSTLPDDSIVKRTYAAHSTLELPVDLRVSGDGADETSVGTQAFDGLGRLTRTTIGTRTERYTYDAGQMQVKTRITPANDTIEYNYNLALTDQPISSSAPDENTGFTYHSVSSRLTQARNEQGRREYEYNTANQLRVERWVDSRNTAWETLHASSMQGRPLKRTELKQTHSAGLDTVYDYDEAGRVSNISQGQLHAAFEYNSLGQLFCTTTTDVAADSTLVTQLQYDDQGREVLRTLTLNQLPPYTQTQTWQVDGLLESRHLQQEGVNLLKETFGYDPRGRLVKHECEGTTLPRDNGGREITRQVFAFDALDNIKLVLTTFADASTERAIFTYADANPCQLQGITYTPARATGNPTFSYDPNGCQLNDERGQRLIYDSQSRLVGVESSAGQVVSQYRYDSHDHLLTSKQGNEGEVLRFYQDEQLSSVDQDGQQTHFLYHTDGPLGQQAADDSQTLLLLTDPNQSVIGESRQRDLRTAVYNAYGERHSDDPLRSLLAFNGEIREQANGWYMLGQGYRAYNPNLMRFHSPDSLSPFGSGGVNPYTYCLGNPIALRDPTGHEAIGWGGRLRRPDEDTPLPSSGSSLEGWISVAIGAVFVVVGAITTVATLGASGPASVAFVLALTATALTAGSTISSAVAVANQNEEAGKWGQYLGYAALVASAPFIVQGAYKGLKSIYGKATGAAAKTKPVSGLVPNRFTQSSNVVNAKPVARATPQAAPARSPTAPSAAPAAVPTNAPALKIPRPRLINTRTAGATPGNRYPYATVNAEPYVQVIRNKANAWELNRHIPISQQPRAWKFLHGVATKTPVRQ